MLESSTNETVMLCLPLLISPYRPIFWLYKVLEQGRFIQIIITELLLLFNHIQIAITHQ